MSRSDRILLHHMLDAARRARVFADGRARRDLDDDDMLLLSLVKLVEIIGEAAVQMSEAGRNQLPTLPWVNIISMRNRWFMPISI